MNKILSIIIPVYNKFNFTRSALDDLSKLPNDHEIIIADNGSTDETQSQLKDSKEIIYLRSETNQGFAKANNYAYNYVTAPNVLFLNNDIRVKEKHSSWTQILIDKCSQGLVGPTMGQLDNKLNFVQEANHILSGKSYMSGWCLASSTKILDSLSIPRSYKINNDLNSQDFQIFSEEFGIAYFEDTDLSFRARKLKIPFIVVDIPVVHFGKVTSKQLNTYQLYKNAREIFVKKWGS
jgi:O-antigen biosynthesis protein